ncbi:MAG: hypothetical protein NTZ35_15180 [Ignavibacteriales bacterium]|nr:hypothetical protein [Ignavibacteriales bacterium]
MSQSARGGWFQFSATGGLFHTDAASKQHVGAGTRDANEELHTEGVSVVILPSATQIPYPSNTADRDEVTGMVKDFISSDAAKTVRSLDPAWRA